MLILPTPGHCSLVAQAANVPKIKNNIE